MRDGSIVDAIFVEAPSSTKNASGGRDPEKPSLSKGKEGLAAEHGIESRKASVRAKVEHPFLVVKRQFGRSRCRYRGIAKNASALTVLFALANVAMCVRAAGLRAGLTARKSNSGDTRAGLSRVNQRFLRCQRWESGFHK